MSTLLLFVVSVTVVLHELYGNRELYSHMLGCWGFYSSVEKRGPGAMPLQAQGQLRAE